jgi:hypothetical protein
MKLFVQNEDDPNYTIIIKNVMWFEFTMDHVFVYMLFQQTAVTIQHAKDRTTTATLTGINNLIVGQYIHVLVGDLPLLYSRSPTCSTMIPCGPSR